MLILGAPHVAVVPAVAIVAVAHAFNWIGDGAIYCTPGPSAASYPPIEASEACSRTANPLQWILQHIAEIYDMFAAIQD